jgi:hypothetical protein
VTVQRVVVESRFRGDVVRNKRYLERCLRDCISRGESPYASHKMLTDCLDDDDPVERRLGIEAGLAWRTVAAHVFYVDLGWSDGMKLAKELYDQEGIPYEERTLPKTDEFWKEEKKAPGPGGLYSLGPATRLFLLDNIQERVDEFEAVETETYEFLQRAHGRALGSNEDQERLDNIRRKLADLRKALEELR